MRPVGELRALLNGPQSATLLGGVQALLDGARLVFERPQPEERLIRALWALLPTAERAELWPSTFCFGNAHRFHVLVVPRATGPEFDHYIPEEQMGDYPEGRYELGLQMAIESGNQADLDSLLARRSRSQTLRLLLILLGVCVVVAIMTARVPPLARPPTTAPRRTGMVLPAPQECPHLAAEEREALACRLQEMALRMGVSVPQGSSEDDLSDALAAVDHRLHASAQGRDPGPLAHLGAVQRQVRALLWKHGISGYDNQALNTVELIELLRPEVDRVASAP